MEKLISSLDRKEGGGVSNPVHLPPKPEPINLTGHGLWLVWDWFIH